MKNINDVENLIRNAFRNTFNYTLQSIDRFNFHVRNNSGNPIAKINIERYNSTIRDYVFTISITDFDNQVKHRFLCFENSHNSLQFYRDINLML